MWVCVMGECRIHGSNMTRSDYQRYFSTRHMFVTSNLVNLDFDQTGLASKRAEKNGGAVNLFICMHMGVGQEAVPQAVHIPVRHESRSLAVGMESLLPMADLDGWL